MSMVHIVTFEPDDGSGAACLTGVLLHAVTANKANRVAIFFRKFMIFVSK